MRTVPNEVHPEERGYYWGTRYTDCRKIFRFCPENLPQNAELSLDRDGDAFEVTGEVAADAVPRIEGMSAQQWSETVRTDEQWETMLFPRLLAVAERSWHTADWELAYTTGRRFKLGETAHTDAKALETEWAAFAQRLGRFELPRLAEAGWTCWLPPPGAQLLENRELDARGEFPFLGIEVCVCPGNPHRGDHGTTGLTTIEASDGRPRVGVGVSGGAGGALIAQAKAEAAAAGVEPLGARPPPDAEWITFDAVMATVIPSGGEEGVTVWLRTVLGGRHSRATALVVV